MTNNSLAQFTADQTISAALLETIVRRAQISILAAGDNRAVQAARDRLVDDLDWLAMVGGAK